MTDNLTKLKEVLDTLEQIIRGSPIVEMPIGVGYSLSRRMTTSYFTCDTVSFTFRYRNDEDEDEDEDDREYSIELEYSPKGRSKSTIKTEDKNITCTERYLPYVSMYADFMEHINRQYLSWVVTVYTINSDFIRSSFGGTFDDNKDYRINDKQIDRVARWLINVTEIAFEDQKLIKNAYTS